MLAEDIEQKIGKTIAEVNADVFVVDIEFKKGKKSVLNIRVDKDQGISLAECATISRELGKVLEDELDFSYTLEVSSPGVGFPLKLHRQYVNNTGRALQVLKQDGITVRGKLLEVSKEFILLNPLPEQKRKSKGRKKQKPVELTKEIKIEFTEIKEAKVIII